MLEDLQAAAHRVQHNIGTQGSLLMDVSKLAAAQCEYLARLSENAELATPEWWVEIKPERCKISVRVNHASSSFVLSFYGIILISKPTREEVRALAKACRIELKG